VSTFVRTLIVFACLGALAACRSQAPLDPLARQYVELARAIEARQAGRAADIVVLRARVANVDEQDGRRAFLLAQLAALERRARFFAGERGSIREEALALGLPLPSFDPQRAASLRTALDAALPGAGSLGERLAHNRRTGAVERSQLGAVAERLVAECRAQAHLDLPEAGVELRYVIESPWPAFTSYRGSGRSLVEIRRDVTWHEDDLRIVLCHETYPGHHVQNLVWDDLRIHRGWEEFAVTPMFTPQAVMAERLAVAATALAWPREKRGAVSRILDDLAPHALAIALAAADGTQPRDTALTQLRNDVLMPNPEAFLDFVREHRAMAVAYTTPVPGVRDWQSYIALLRSPARLVAGSAASP
jgi:hypothetical protein